MASTGRHIEGMFVHGCNGTGGETGLVRTGLAGMRTMRCRLVLDRDGKAERAAITVPEAVGGVDENAKRRSFQAFCAHRPLLERLPWRIGWKPRRRFGYNGNGTDDFFRPRIERIRPAAIRLVVPPAGKSRPEGAADVADQHDTGCGAAIAQRWSGFPRRKIHDTAQKKTVRLKSRTDRFEVVAGRTHRVTSPLSS